MRRVWLSTTFQSHVAQINMSQINMLKNNVYEVFVIAKNFVGKNYACIQIDENNKLKLLNTIKYSIGCILSKEKPPLSNSHCPCALPYFSAYVYVLFNYRGGNK